MEEGDCLFGYVCCLLCLVNEVSEVFSFEYIGGVLCLGVLEDFGSGVLMLFIVSFVCECLWLWLEVESGFLYYFLCLYCNGDFDMLFVK